MTFKFELNQAVVIKATGQTGAVIGRADYVDSAPNYLVEHKSAEGDIASLWLREGALDAA